MATDSLRPQFRLRPAFKLKGHQSVVLCCAASGSRIASGDEDGLLLVHDLISAPPYTSAVHTARTAAEPASSAAAGDSSGALGPTGHSAASAAPAAKPLHAIQLKGADGQPAAVSALAANPQCPETSIFAAAGSRIHNVDLRTDSVVHTYGSSAEEINGLCVNARGTHLAAGDDGGEAQVYDLAAGRLFKGIRNVHRSICSSVAFRTHKPWDLLTGGLDSTVAKYDISRPKCIDRWDMNALQPAAGAGGGGGGGQIFNPPFVHQIAVPPGDGRPACQWVAAARGDGAVVVLDADVSSAASGSSGPTTAVAAAATAGTRRSGRGGGGGGGAGRGTGKVLMQPLVLDRDVGGHTKPVCSIAFAPSGGLTAAPAEAAAPLSSTSAADAAGPGWRDAAGSGAVSCRLYSGGEDCRVVLWDIGGALAARAAGLPLVSPAAAAAAGGSAAAGRRAGGSKDGRDAGHGGREEEGAEGDLAEAACAGEGDGELLGTSGGSAEGSRGRAPVLAEVHHGRKVNQLCCLEMQGAELVSVAAVSKFVVVYRTEVDL